MPGCPVSAHWFEQQVEEAFAFLKSDYGYRFSPDHLIRGGVAYVHSMQMLGRNIILRVDHEVTENWLGLRILTRDNPSVEFDLLDVVRRREPRAMPRRLPAHTRVEVERSLGILAQLLQVWASDMLSQVESLQTQRSLSSARGGCLPTFLRLVLRLFGGGDRP